MAASEGVDVEEEEDEEEEEERWTVPEAKIEVSVKDFVVAGGT